LLVSGLGCTNWAGSAQYNYSGGPNLPGGPYFPNVITATTDAQGVKFTKSSENWGETSDVIMFKPTAGTVKWTFTQDIGGDAPSECTGSFKDSYSLPGSPDPSLLLLGDINGARKYLIVGQSPAGVNDNNYMLTCKMGPQQPASASQ